MHALRVGKRSSAQKALNTPSVLHLGAFIFSVASVLFDCVLPSLDYLLHFARDLPGVLVDISELLPRRGATSNHDNFETHNFLM